MFKDNMLTIQNLCNEHPLLVALEYAITAQEQYDKAKVMGVAIKIFEAATGNVIAEYDSLIKISREEWDQGDAMIKSAYGITFEDIMDRGIGKEEVGKQIGTIFKIHNVFKRPICFLGFSVNSKFNHQLFPHGIPCPSPDIRGFLERREVGRPVWDKKKPVFSYNDMGKLESPIQLVSFSELGPKYAQCSYSYPQLLGKHGFVRNEDSYTPKMIVDDIHLVYCKILRDRPPVLREDGDKPPTKRARHE